ncbi:hypothetical protein SJ05684_c34970 [Sinorhizobium sojae CCBAU 05684]|uniref:Uncharacterized protein n=1 Tax=Sinorhizobium sojae CCBAU 05684 TaxID=716928 RepID=A0A249PG34_9HYPH|nr:hypothetical protein SJ05684_c34970 [Sinorhizobium sojae CCBAU 05684]
MHAFVSVDIPPFHHVACVPGRWKTHLHPPASCACAIDPRKIKPRLLKIRLRRPEEF